MIYAFAVEEDRPVVPRQVHPSTKFAHGKHSLLTATALGFSCRQVRAELDYTLMLYRVNRFEFGSLLDCRSFFALHPRQGDAIRAVALKTPAAQAAAFLEGGCKLTCWVPDEPIVCLAKCARLERLAIQMPLLGVPRRDSGVPVGIADNPVLDEELECKLALSIICLDARLQELRGIRSFSLRFVTRDGDVVLAFTDDDGKERVEIHPDLKPLSPGLQALVTQRTQTISTLRKDISQRRNH